MKPVIQTILALPFIIPFMAPSQTTPEAKIRSLRQASNEALKHHDLPAFAASLDETFSMVRGNGTAIPTRQGYIDAFQKDFANPDSVVYERTPDKIELSTAAPLAAEHGRWVGRRKDGSPAYRGTYLAMWTSTPSGWKLRSELFILLACDD